MESESKLGEGVFAILIASGCKQGRWVASGHGSTGSRSWVGQFTQSAFRISDGDSFLNLNSKLVWIQSEIIFSVY